MLFKKEIKFSPKSKLSLLALSLIVSGCASNNIANSGSLDAEVLAQSKNLNQTPVQVCDDASFAIIKANKEQLNIYAPLHFEQASNSFTIGQEKIKTKDTVKKGADSCLKTIKLIENGITVKSKVTEALSDSIAAIAQLKKVDENKVFTSEIQDIIETQIDLAKDIEAEKINEAMAGQAELINDANELEIKIISHRYLRPVELMIAKAKKTNADIIAEQTFDKAQSELKSAKEFIQVNYRDQKQVALVSAEAMQAASHVYYVAKEVEKLQNLNYEEAEQKVLYFESLLEQINARFNQKVLIGHSLYEQVTIIENRLGVVLNKQNPIKTNSAKVEQIKQEKPTPATVETAEEIQVTAPIVTKEKITAVKSDVIPAAVKPAEEDNKIEPEMVGPKQEKTKAESSPTTDKPKQIEETSKLIKNK